MDKAKAAGNEIIEMPDKKPFQDAVKPVWDKYGPEIRRHDQAHPGGPVGNQLDPRAWRFSIAS